MWSLEFLTAMTADAARHAGHGDRSALDAREGERLHQLLLVEHRLEELVRAASQAAARRVAGVRASSEERLAAARDAAVRAAAAEAESERSVHERALSSIEATSQAALDDMGRLPEARVDELARWALTEVIGKSGEPP